MNLYSLFCNWYSRVSHVSSLMVIGYMIIRNQCLLKLMIQNVVFSLLPGISNLHLLCSVGHGMEKLYKDTRFISKLRISHSGCDANEEKAAYLFVMFSLLLVCLVNYVVHAWPLWHQF